MKVSKLIAIAGLAASSLFVTATGQSAFAQTIADQWSSVKPPPAPQLQSVTVDPKTTAYLVLDLVPRICAKVPSCVASLPKVAAFLKKARAHNMPVVYSIVGGVTTADIYKRIAPTASDPYVQAHADKFIGTDLNKILKNLHVTTIIPVGSAADGAVLYTASHAAFLGYKVIVPLDGASARDPYAEQATAYILANAPGVGTQTTLTSFDKIGW